MIQNCVLCVASEKGKIIVNRCLNKGFHINTLKLEKLLIIIHGCTLARYNRPFFPENIVTTQYGLMIPQVDEDFSIHSLEFNEQLEELIFLLDAEEEVINYVVNKYGNCDAFELDEMNELQALKDIGFTAGRTNIIPNTLIKGVFDYNDPRREYKRVTRL